MTDYGSAYRPRRFAKALRWLGIRNIFSAPALGLSQRHFAA
jgi:transposase InsO family protein